MEASKNYYATLGVARDAEAVVIRAAYKALSQRYHPDKYPPPERAAAHQRMSEINEAFDVLSDPVRRVAYDEQTPHTSGQEPMSGTTSAHAGALTQLAPLGIIVVTVLVALQLAVDKKSWWTLTWEFMSSGLQRPSSYDINWLLLTAIMFVGFRVAWLVHRRLKKS